MPEDVKVQGWLDTMRSVLLEKQMPVWLTLLILVSGAAGTYLLLPRVNQEFEQQRIRTEFVISKLEALNQKTNELISNITVLNNRVLRQSPVSEEMKDGIGRNIVELQWKAIELSVMFNSEKSGRLINEYQKKLDALRVVIEEEEQNTPEILKRVEAFVLAAIQLMEFVSQEADVDGKSFFLAVHSDAAKKEKIS